eukprot:COSAG01_NODE_20835_length_932_cov_71.434574_3_plen_25_part_01
MHALDVLTQLRCDLSVVIFIALERH